MFLIYLIMLVIIFTSLIVSVKLKKIRIIVIILSIIAFITFNMLVPKSIVLLPENEFIEKFIKIDWKSKNVLSKQGFCFVDENFANLVVGEHGDGFMIDVYYQYSGYDYFKNQTNMTTELSDSCEYIYDESEELNWCYLPERRVCYFFVKIDDIVIVAQSKGQGGQKNPLVKYVLENM